MEKRLASRKEMDALLKEADTSNISLQQLLLKRNVSSERDILNILAEELHLSYVDIRGSAIDKSVIAKVPVKIVSYYKFIPLKLEGRLLTIAVSNPLDIKMQDEIRTQLGYDIEIVLACEQDIIEALKANYGLAADTLEKIVTQASAPYAMGDFEATVEKVEDIERLVEDASVIRLVNQIILDAYRRRATDIHIEPYRDSLGLRYRIDGFLYDANIPAEMRNFLNAIISRIKIMSNLNIVERRLPQDGRAVVRVQEQVLDLRISIIPTPYGESVVIRILPTKMLYSLEKLGLARRDLMIFENLIQKPHGIIFVTGPTGSGKTTTLYACLSRINTRERKIVTIEDPIEYEMSGITQIQVMPEIGLDFARGLRSMLRHDPDVMMVGEVRDLETAEIAIRVALTGHLIFSTLHTNDAASGITRLIDIGVEPYLVSSSVEAFIAQRLVRVICPDCRYEDRTAEAQLKELIAKELGTRPTDEIRIFKGKGCPACNGTGFFGRTGIYEIILTDDSIKELMLKKVPSNQIKKIAISHGMRTLRQDGWQKVLLGITTPEEVMKVTSAEAEGKSERTAGSYPLPEGAGYVKSTLNEKRLFQRLESKINLRHKLVKSYEGVLQPQEAEHLSATEDISAGGLLLVVQEQFPIGSILELKIELPNGERPLVCLAKVVRIEARQDKAFNAAVCFLDLSGSERARLERYVIAE